MQDYPYFVFVTFSVILFFLGCLFDESLAQTKTCNCSCYNLDAALANDPVLQEKVENITKELKLDSKNTSAHLRSLSSAEDSRPSAQAAGYFGIAMLSLVFGSLVLLDFSRFCMKSKGGDEIED